MILLTWPSKNTLSVVPFYLLLHLSRSLPRHTFTHAIMSNCDPSIILIASISFFNLHFLFVQITSLSNNKPSVPTEACNPSIQTLSHYPHTLQWFQSSLLSLNFPMVIHYSHFHILSISLPLPYFFYLLNVSLPPTLCQYPFIETLLKKNTNGTNSSHVKFITFNLRVYLYYHIILLPSFGHLPKPGICKLHQPPHLTCTGQL